MRPCEAKHPRLAGLSPGPNRHLPRFRLEAKTRYAFPHQAKVLIAPGLEGAAACWHGRARGATFCPGRRRYASGRSHTAGYRGPPPRAAVIRPVRSAPVFLLRAPPVSVLGQGLFLAIEFLACDRISDHLFVAVAIAVHDHHSMSPCAGGMMEVAPDVSSERTAALVSEERGMVQDGSGSA